MFKSLGLKANFSMHGFGDNYSPQRYIVSFYGIY